MVCHLWGEEGFDWAGLDAAAAYIAKGLRKWGRVGVTQYKEKYGTARIYVSFGFGISWWPQLTHPGYCRNTWPKWTWLFQHKPQWAFRLLNIVVVPYHKWLYRRYYRRAIKQWPHLCDEILCCADFPEILEGLKWEGLQRLL